MEFKLLHVKRIVFETCYYVRIYYIQASLRPNKNYCDEVKNKSSIEWSLTVVDTCSANWPYNLSIPINVNPLSFKTGTSNFTVSYVLLFSRMFSISDVESCIRNNPRLVFSISIK